MTPVDYGKFIADGRCHGCGRVAPIWTPDEIVKAMIAWAANHGRPPTSTSWRTASREHPSAERVRIVFGSFKRGQAAAGMRTVRSLTGVVWTRATIRQALFEWRFEHGRSPKAEEWRASEDPRWPSTSTVIRLFGSWNKAIVSAGYTPGYVRKAAA